MANCDWLAHPSVEAPSQDFWLRVLVRHLHGQVHRPIQSAHSLDWPRLAVG